MTPIRSRLAAAVLMLAFAGAIVAALSVHPRSSTIDAATEGPATQPISADLSTSSEVAAPTTAAPSSSGPSSTWSTSTGWKAPTAPVSYAVTTTTAKRWTGTTAPAAPKPAAASVPPTTRATTPVYVPPPPTAAPGGGSSDMAFLACVRQRESGGNYSAVSPSGYYGAYQFGIDTWNNTAQHAGRSDLVGVRPDHAAPGDQDAMALHLLQWMGRGPWGGYCG